MWCVYCREQAEPFQVSPPTCKKAKLEGDAATATATEPSAAPSSISFPHSASSVSTIYFLSQKHWFLVKFCMSSMLDFLVTSLLDMII